MLGLPCRVTLPGASTMGHEDDRPCVRKTRTHLLTLITLLLTLETSSHMVGADELSLRSAALRLAMAHRQSDIGVLYADLARAGVLTRNLLSR